MAPIPHNVTYTSVGGNLFWNMSDKAFDFDKRNADEWRELGFYIDSDDRIGTNQWRFYGSKAGLGNFVSMLDEYVNDAQMKGISEHDHWGPYFNLKLMTWDKPIITGEYIAGTIADLTQLRAIIARKLENALPGQTFDIDKDYGQENTMTAKFFVMSDDFDPASMDELVISKRQEAVNRDSQKKRSE